MNKYQEALNNIAIPLAETDFIAEHREDFKTLKELVDKETPMKPKMKIIEKYEHCYYCPNCENLIPYGDNYCYSCGQKIDWSTMNNER